MTTSADSIINGVRNLTGGQFVNYNGQQVLVGGDTMDSLNSSATSYSSALASQGKPGVSAFEYDKLTNPTSYGARWANDGTALQYDASGNLVSGTQGTALPHGSAGGIVNGGTLSPNTVSAAATERVGSPTAWNVTPDQTVEGRINSIVNGTVGDQARAGAKGEMNERGLTNSTMAITAGQDAAYRAAIPIAQSDAATFAKAAGYNADQINQVNVKNAEMGNSMNQANLGANTSWAQANLSARTSLATATIGADTQTAIAKLNSSTQLGMNALDNQTKLTAQTWANENQVLLNTSSQAATAFNQYVVSATSIQNNPNMDATTKNTALQTLWQTTQAGLTVLSKLNGLDLTSMLDMSSINPPSPTPAPTPEPIVGGINEADRP